MTISDLIRKNTLPPLDAELLLSYALKKPREYIFVHPEKILKKKQIAKFYRLSKRRAESEPVAYITGKKEFYGLDFFVNRNVLIPRPETELLVELSIKQIQKYEIQDTSIVDIGTGSGNIIVSIFKNLSTSARKKIFLYGTDISDSALRAARKNAKHHEVNKKTKFIKSDLLKYFIDKKYFLAGNIIIVANLPYVSPALYKAYGKNLRYEPKESLVSRSNGLFCYERLFQQAKKLLFADHCSLIIEISPEQKRLINDIIQKILPGAKIEFFRDLAGRWRAAKIILDKK